MLDIFNNDAFSVTTLTDTINKIKFVPGRIGEMNLFQATGVATTSVVIEERNGVLALISPSARGGPGSTVLKPLRSARSIRVPHFEINDAIMAEEVQGVRAWGTETDVQTVQNLVGDRLSIHTQSMSMTQEFSRIGAIKGLVTYADGSTLDLFDEFKVSAASEVFLDLGNADPVPGALRRKISNLARTVATQLGGIPLQTLYAFCGDDFFDDLVSHPEVRETYLGWLAAQELRTGFVSGSGLSWGSFPFGGVVWENYRGAVDVTPFIDADLAHVFPVGVPGFFRTYYAPADYIETVNTIGQRMYAKQYPMDNGKGINLDAQMNALDICTRPNALVKVSRLAS